MVAKMMLRMGAALLQTKHKRCVESGYEALQRGGGEHDESQGDIRHVNSVETRVHCRHYEPLTETLALFAGLLARAARVRVRGEGVTRAAGRVAGLAHAVLGNCRYVCNM